MEKKNVIFLTILAVATLLTAIVGSTFAYYTATVGGTGNSASPTTVKTAVVAGVEYNTGQVASATNVYPGWKGIHKFTIKLPDGTPSNAVGGQYTVTITPNVPSVFGSDIKYTIYSTTSSTDNITRTAGALVNNNGKLSRTDTLNYAGNWASSRPTAISQGVLSNSKITLPAVSYNGQFKTTYYFLVLEYLNSEEDQMDAMGGTFTAKVDVSVTTD